MNAISTTQTQERLSAGDLYWFVCQRCDAYRVESIPRNITTQPLEICGFVAWITTDDVESYPPTYDELAKLRQKYQDLTWPITLPTKP